jgi:hypothetical protein
MLALLALLAMLAMIVASPRFRGEVFDLGHARTGFLAGGTEPSVLPGNL